ncbi:plasmid partition protein, putative yagE1 (plasmid) [Streptomyces sp. L7]|uniref:ParB family protein n=1 Tax=Actinomycetes TaxID=1760 RepID=UPI00389A6719
MNRPAPRKSSLAGSSPITPPPAAAPAAVDATGWTQEQHEDADHVEQTRQLQEAERAAAKAKPAPREPKSRAKVSFYQDPADTDRVRGAILYTMTTEGSRNLSQFIHKAVMAEVERLEAKYNNGQQFPPVGARELPQGAAAANL